MTTTNILHLPQTADPESDAMRAGVDLVKLLGLRPDQASRVFAALCRRFEGGADLREGRGS